MGRFFKPFALAAGVFAMISVAAAPEAMLGAGFVGEAQAFVVVAHHPPRPMAVVGAVAVTTAVVASTTANASAAKQANANAAQANQAAAQANQSAAQANQAAAEAKAAAAKAPPPVGTIVTTLPPGCTQTKLNNVDYMRCGSTYYKPTMAGDAVVFVVAQP